MTYDDDADISVFTLDGAASGRNARPGNAPYLRRHARR